MKPKYTVREFPFHIVCIRITPRYDGMAEMHVINKATGEHIWEVAPLIGAMNLVNGKSGLKFPFI